jgi:ABC-type transporter Mla subunit MlaD
VKTQAYCDLNKLEGEVKAADQKNDTKTLEALSKQAKSLVDKLGPEYYKLMDGLEQVDPKSGEAKEFMSILSGLDKSCTK